MNSRQNVDTLRWGDSDKVVFPGGATTLASKMLCYATTPKGGRPIVWGVLISIIPQIVAGDGSAYTAVANLTVGCGASTIPFPQPFTYTSPLYTPTSVLLSVPANNIMANVVVGSAGGSLAGSNFQVAIFAAPFTDPTYMAEMAELMGGPDAEARQPGDDMHGRPFQEEYLRQHHNR